MGGICSTHRAIKNSYSNLVDKPNGKRPLSVEDNINVDVKELRFEGVNRFRLTKDRVEWKILENAIVNFFII
jgi:hypothetical protein